MFAEGFITEHIFEILGLLVTVVGVWLVVKQLNETRLASHMEGMIALSQLETKRTKDAKALDEFADLDNWQKLTGEEAYSSIKGSDAYMSGYLAYAEVFGLVGALVRTGALDVNVAATHFAYNLPWAWRRYEKVTKVLRKEFGSRINENWEWMAIEFEKLDS